MLLPAMRAVICSADVERLAFSVIWEVTPEAEVGCCLRLCRMRPGRATAQGLPRAPTRQAAEARDEWHDPASCHALAQQPAALKWAR